MNKEDVVKAVLEDKDMYISIHDISEAVPIVEKITIYRSLLGSTLNQVYDAIVELSGGDSGEFAKLVLGEVTKEFRMIMFLLYLQVPIEEEMNKIILDNYEKILAS